MGSGLEGQAWKPRAQSKPPASLAWTSAMEVVQMRDGGGSDRIGTVAIERCGWI